MANEGVVGILKAILTADTTSFDVGMKKAAAAPAAVQKSVTSLTEEVKKLAPQAERMVKSFGGDKLLYQANNLTAAVQKLGGAQKLTEAEQAKVNKTLTEAIAKYKLLGQEAPQALREIEQATRKVSQPTALATHATNELKTSFLTLTSSLALSSVITSAVTGLVSLGREAVASAGHLVDMAGKTGLSLTSLQKMQFVADQTGASIDDFSQAAFLLGVNLAKGGDEVQRAVDGLKELHVSYEDLRGLSPDQQFEMVAEALKHVTNEQERNRLAVVLFGKSAKEILPAISEGYANIAKDAAIASDAQIRAIDRYADRADQFFRNSGTHLLALIGEELALQDAIKDVTAEWEKQGILIDKNDVIDAARRRINGRQGDVSLPSLGSGAAVGTADYVAQLKAAQAELKKLSADQRAELAAAKQLGTVQEDDLARQFNISTTAVKLFSAETKKSSDSVIENAKKYGTLTSALVATQDAVAGLTTGQRAEIDAGLTLGVSTDDIAKKMGLAKEVVASYSDQVRTAAQFQREMTAEIEKTLEAARKAAEEAGNRKGLSQAAGVLRSAVNIDKAGDSTAKVEQQIAIQRADFEAEQAERAGASWQMVFALQQQSAQLRLDAELSAERQRFTAVTAGLDESGAEFDAYAQEYNARVREMTEAFTQGEALKQQSMSLTHDSFAVFGLKTRDELQAEAATFKAAYDEMAASGLATAQTLKEAWERYEQARRASMEQSTLSASEQGDALLTGAQNVFTALGAKYKAAAIAGAIIATYSAIAKALASAPFPFNLALAAGAAAVGFANVAKIKASKAGFRAGTADLDFQDFGAETPVNLHQQEAVIPRGGGHRLAAEIAGSLRLMMSPPALTVPVSLQSGSAAVPSAPAGMASTTHEVHNHYYTVQGWDGEDIDRVFRREIIPRQKRALQLNQDDLRGHTKRVLE